MANHSRRDLIPYNTYLHEDQLFALKAIREETGVAAAFVIRRAIDEYLRRREEQEAPGE